MEKRCVTATSIRSRFIKAYALLTLGVIDEYAAITNSVGALLFLLCAIAGLIHIRRTPEDATI
jgi:hypothetical protein